MKISVITMDAVPNYGSVLQAYATKKILEKHGCDVEIINYVRENEKYENLPDTWSNGNVIKKLVIKPTIKKWKRVFGEFRKEQLGITGKIYTTEEDFNDYPVNADAFCTGSDQVWNSVWNEGIIPPLYLSFLPKEKYRFAFSASFGQSKLQSEEIERTKDYISKYKHISVRERSGVEILNEQYHFDNVVQLVDPTVLLRDTEWRAVSPRPKYKSPYILIYNLNRSKEFDEYAVKLSKYTGIRLVRFCTRYDQFYRPGKSLFIPDVFEFVTLIDNAKYVLTDSFHATAFSLNMGTEPICIYPNSFSNRISSFLELTNTLYRHIENYNDFEVIERKVNFDSVNRILENERRKADDYLDMVISEI